MFEIRTEGEGRVSLAGRFDAAEADEALLVFRGLQGPLEVDCARLDYVSSAGIAVFMDTYKRLTSAGHGLRLVNLTPRVRNVFVYAGLDKLLGIT